MCDVEEFTLMPRLQAMVEHILSAVVDHLSRGDDGTSSQGLVESENAASGAFF